jgi:hypothetical protein
VDEGHGIVDKAEHAVAGLIRSQAEVIGYVEPAGIAEQRLDDRVLLTELTERSEEPGTAPAARLTRIARNFWV